MRRNRIAAALAALAILAAAGQAAAAGSGLQCHAVNAGGGSRIVLVNGSGSTLAPGSALFWEARDASGVQSTDGTVILFDPLEPGERLDTGSPVPASATCTVHA